MYKSKHKFINVEHSLMHSELSFNNTQPQYKYKVQSLKLQKCTH